MIPNTAESARNWLKSRHILVPEDWVEACVEWICEENQDAQNVQTQINDLVYEQWLLADLHELQSKCLPNEITSTNKFQLSGVYALQIDSLMDVGQPYYSQLQKVKGTENANTLVSGDAPAQKPWEPKPTRMLMMKLTDGTINVQGMEYKPLANLNPQINPGTKILVKGSILCRHGVLMLTANNVQVLGGEVDTLVESNTQEKVLQEALDTVGQNVGRELKQEFDGGPVQRDKKNVIPQPQPGVRNNIPVQNRPGVCHNLPVQNRNQSNTGMSKVKTEVKQELEWDDDFALDDFMDDMEECPMNRPDPLTSTSNSASSVKRPKVEPNRTGTLGQVQKQPNIQQNTPRLRTGNQGSTIVKQEMFDDSMDLGNPVPSASNMGLGGGNVLGKKFASVSVKSEKDMEQKFLANLKSRSFSSSTPLKPFESIPRTLSGERSTLGGDRKRFKSDIPEQMDLDDFDDDLDDFDLASVDNSIPVSDLNQATTSASPANRLSNTSLNFDSSNSAHENSNRKLSGPRPSDNEILNNSASSSKKTGDTKPCNTMDRYLRSPSSRDRSNDSISGDSPSRRSLNRSAADDVLDKFNLVKCCLTHPSESSVTLRTEPFTYLSKVISCLPVQQSLTFKVKAYVSTLNGRLECPRGDKWVLSCKINDGSGTMDVDLSNQVLTILIGFSAKDSMEMRKRIKSDPTIRDILAEGIQQCQQKLIELLCIMEIEINPGLQKPEVISLIPMSNSHTSALHSRVSDHLNKVML